MAACRSCYTTSARQSAYRSARFLHVSEDSKLGWSTELAKGGEALQREAMRIVKAAEQLAASSPARPFTRRIVRAVSAGIRELAAPEPVVHGLTLATTVTGTSSVTGVSTITAVGSVVLPPMRFAGEGTVQQPDLIERNIGRIFALVLLTPGCWASTHKIRRPWATTRA